MRSVSRPFSASGRRNSSLLTVLVHGAQVHLSGDGTEHPAAGTFVVLSLCESSTAECRLETHTAPYELYSRRFSPFGATRVLEQSHSAAAWNELLLAQLPSVWRENATKQTSASSLLGVKLELVQRGASQQEDYLLASAVLPLWTIACHHQQIRLALQFQSSSVFVSLRETVSSAQKESTRQRLEIVIQSFRLEASSETPPDSLSLFLQSTPDTLAQQTCDGREQHSARLFTRAFEAVQHGHCFSQEHGLFDAPLSALTPSASVSPSEASGTLFEWQFPCVFELTDAELAALVHDSEGEMNVTLFNTSAASTAAHHAIGQGRLQLLTEPQAEKNGRVISFNTAIYDLRDRTRVLGHMQGRVRWWDSLAWQQFMANAPARRVVCTNRRDRKHDPLLALPWMGALARGLNRHPVSSFCDEGGISGILSSLLASPQEETKAEQTMGSTTEAAAEQNNGAAVNALLKDHIAKLQQDLLEKRQQTDRLQTELDERLAAIRTCGMDLVALRRELKQKDEQMASMRVNLDAATERERQQTKELTSTTQPVAPTAQKFALIATRYKELELQHEKTSKQLEEAQQSLAQYHDLANVELQARHAELEQAHLVQAALVQRLQKERRQIATLRKAVQVQERVIQQFEQTVATQAEPMLLQETKSQLRSSDPSESAEEMLRLRVQVLEEQLQTNARQAAKEISELRMRLYHLEANGDRGHQ